MLAFDGKLVKQQDLAEHLWHFLSSLQDLGKYSTPLVVSHPWLDPRHPDPFGHHAREIAQWLRDQTGDGWDAKFYDCCGAENKVECRSSAYVSP